MKVLVVDDEPLARKRLSRLLSEVPGAQLAGEAENGRDALLQAAKLLPDVVLLDIEMPGMNGVDVATQLSAQEPAPAVVFCTAHDEYAISAFEAAAVAYLVKPVAPEALNRALTRARRLNRVQIAAVVEQSAPAPPMLRLRHDEGVDLRPLSEVQGFRADSKRVFVVCDDGEHLVEETLAELEAAYPEELTRIHRASLVATSRVRGLHRDGHGGFVVVLRDSEWAPAVSRRHLPALRRLLKQA